ncbi:unnamed protein product [Arabidopsis halleri]
MHLKQNFYSNDALLENLISSCPVLEVLTVIRNVGTEKTVKFSRVRSQSLQSLVLVLDGQGDVTYDREVVIDAPRLKYFESLRDYQSRSFAISNLISYAKVDIDVDFDVFYNHSAGNISSKRSAVRKFLIGLSNVRDMTICGKTLKINLSLLEVEPRTAAPVSSNPWFCFASGFLDFHKDSCLHKFKIFGKRKDVSMCTIMWWLHNAVKRKIRHLDVECYLEQTIDMVPLSLYLSETLVSLRLKCLVLVCFEFVSLPNLKSLNSLKIVVDCTKEWCIGANGDWKVFIDAPRLACLTLIDTYSVSFEISNLGSSAEVDIDVSFKVNKIWDLDDSFDRSNVGKLLTGLSSVRDMTIRETTLKDLQKVRGRVENEEISLSSSSVPKCLQSSLEDVAIIRPNYGNGAEMKLSKYFLENSVVLKRFTLDMDCDNEEQENIIFEQFETVQRRSIACEASLVVRDMMYPLSELML